MKDFITKSQKHLLWQDELGDNFLLLKFGEVFKYSNSLLKVHSFSTFASAKMLKMGIVSKLFSTDDPMDVLTCKVSNLQAIIKLGEFKRRPYIKGNWIKEAEKKLAHKILPYNPRLEA